MNRLFLSCLLGVASLTSLPAAALVTGTLTDYIALGMTGGTIGNTRFSSFMLLPLQTGAEELSPDTIIITPSSSGSVRSLEFTVNDSAVDTDLFESRFSYRVSDSPIRSAMLSIAGATTAGASSVSVVSDLIIATQPDRSLIVLLAGPDNIPDDSVDFPSTTSLLVMSDITLDGGSSGTTGMAALATTTSRFVIPEPASLALFAPIAGLLALRRRRS